MTTKGHTPDAIARAERVVSSIRGISSCRITTDGDGEITEVHVVATTRKSPKLVARDVETCLAAELGMAVDYRKIGVVFFESSTTADREKGDATRPSYETVAEFPVEEYASRFAFQSVNVFVSQDGVQAEVELVRNRVETLGTSRSENPDQHMRVVSEATLKAIGELLDDTIKLCLCDVVEILVGAQKAVVCKVDVIRNREGRSLVGCSLYAGNTNQTVVFATLDAVNRVLGVLKTGSPIEYKIK
jgi:hypothetical protein